jgi:cytochrome c556
MRRFNSICLAALLSLCFAVPGLAQDKEKAVKERQAAMKQQGRDLVVVRNYFQGKADQAAAVAAIDAAQKSVAAVPDLFPPGTGIGQISVKNRAKPEIWQQQDKFAADQKTVLGQLAQLEVAVKAGDKTKVEAVFKDIGFCKACHNDFRAKED